MANHKSAEKRARQTIKKNERNTAYMSSVKTTLKKFYSALGEAKKSGAKDSEELKSTFINSQSMLQKAATKGIIHKNNAARKVSRLAHSVASLTATK